MNWTEAVERTVAGLGYDLVETERSAGGLLRVYIDRVPGRAYDTGVGEFVTVDDCEKVTRQLQHVLEVEGCAYERLEVSSPGLDRPLRREADYERFVGERVALTLKLPFQGRKRFQGVLQRVEAAPQMAAPVAAEAGVEVGSVPAPALWRLVLDDEAGQGKKGAKPARKVAGKSGLEAGSGLKALLQDGRASSSAGEGGGEDAAAGAGGGSGLKALLQDGGASSAAVGGGADGAAGAGGGSGLKALLQGTVQGGGARSVGGPSGPIAASAAIPLKTTQAAQPQQALDFALNEVREARLVPVVDFKGRRFVPQQHEQQAPDAAPDEELAASDQEDGGRDK